MANHDPKVNRFKPDPNEVVLPNGFSSTEGENHVFEDGQLMIDFNEQPKSKTNAYTETLRGELAQSLKDNGSGFSKHLVWTTKDKRRIPIPHMEDSHLLNTIAFLRRRVEPVYKKQLLKKLLKQVILSTALLMDPFDNGDGDGGVYDHSDYIKQLEGEAVKEGRRILGMSTDEFLREFQLQFPYLLQEAYKRKLLIESHDNYSIEPTR